MSKRAKKPELSKVMYSYVWNDTQFDAFLKMLIHDYLAADSPYTKPAAQIGGLVESSQN